MVPALPSPSSIRLSVCLRREGERKDVDMDLPLRRVGHYYETHQILVVGDGDFSFSLSLAKGFGDATNMVCTSLDDEGTMFCSFFSSPGALGLQRWSLSSCALRYPVAFCCYLFTSVNFKGFMVLFSHVGSNGFFFLCYVYERELLFAFIHGERGYICC